VPIAVNSDDGVGPCWAAAAWPRDSVRAPKEENLRLSLRKLLLSTGAFGDFALALRKICTYLAPWTVLVDLSGVLSWYGLRHAFAGYVERYT
jgi:hypothetical protein